MKAFAAHVDAVGRSDRIVCGPLTIELDGGAVLEPAEDVPAALGHLRDDREVDAAETLDDRAQLLDRVAARRE